MMPSSSDEPDEELRLMKIVAARSNDVAIPDQDLKETTNTANKAQHNIRSHSHSAVTKPKSTPSAAHVDLANNKMSQPLNQDHQASANNTKKKTGTRNVPIVGKERTPQFSQSTNETEELHLMKIVAARAGMDSVPAIESINPNHNSCSQVNASSGRAGSRATAPNHFLDDPMSPSEQFGLMKVVAARVEGTSNGNDDENTETNAVGNQQGFAPQPPRAGADVEEVVSSSSGKGSIPRGSNGPGAYSRAPGQASQRLENVQYETAVLRTTEETHNDATCEACLPCDNAPLQGQCETVPPSAFQKHRKVGGAVILLVMIIVAIVVTVVVVSSGDQNQKPNDAEVDPTPSDVEVDPTPPDVEVDPALIPNIPDSTLVKLRDKTSPQYKAYSWIVQDPHFDQYEDWRITQRFSLATFFYSMNGPRWLVAASWLDYEVNECEWLSHNLTCHDDMSIKRLDIPWKGGFKGKMPPELTLLTGLEGFNFSYNLLGGNLAGLFGNEFNYSSLRWFDCTRCRLSGTIPVEFAKMTALKHILLKKNEMTGELPSEIGQLQKLQYLGLEDNHLSGAIPTTIGNLQELVILELDRNLFGSLPSEIGRLSDLEKLQLGDNRLRHSIPSELGSMDNMKFLYLDGSRVKGAIPSELGRLTNLKTLLLNRNELSDIIPEEIGSLSKLEWLWMQQNDLVGSIPASVGQMNSLMDLHLGNNALTSTIPSEMGLLLQLEVLGLYQTELSGRIPSEIAGLANLTDFMLNDNPFLLQELPEEFCPNPPTKLTTDWCSDDACCT